MEAVIGLPVITINLLLFVSRWERERPTGSNQMDINGLLDLFAMLAPVALIGALLVYIFFQLEKQGKE
jgi:prolipoprotein diacylglyceryltransferase